MLKLFYSIFVAICLVACSSSEEYTGEFRVFYDQDFDKVLHGSNSRYLEKVLNTEYNDIPQTYVVQYSRKEKDVCKKIENWMALNLDKNKKYKNLYFVKYTKIVDLRNNKSLMGDSEEAYREILEHIVCEGDYYDFKCFRCNQKYVDSL